MFSEGVHVINFLVWWRGLSGRRRPSPPLCLVKYNNVLLPTNAIKFHIINGHICLFYRPHGGLALLGDTV